MMPVRVVLADDHDLVRAGLRNALAQVAELDVVGEVAHGEELTAVLARLRPDLLLIDVSMPNFDPIAAIRQIKGHHPDLKILVVSAYDDEAYVVGVLGAGVNGYHLKDQPLSDLRLAVQRVLLGERWLSSPLVERLILHRGTPPKVDGVAALSQRQKELLQLLMQGCDNRKIAQTLEISIKTVENQLTQLYRALNVNSRLEAANYAVHHAEIFASLEIGKQGTATAVAPTTNPVSPSPSAPDGSPTLYVLLVDDNPRYRQQLARSIGKVYPAAVLFEAENTAEAVAHLQTRPMHLALVDVVLGEEDGIQCTKQLKGVAPGMRVVLMSAYPDREFHRLGLAAGAIAFLDKKDLDLATLRQVLEDLLG